ncbi:MAG: hypothetical protein KBC00_02110 [Candidatus Levybacteria bacterium]|nr:hypothetical protein [Candidatus Levybacteria bacterium]MBP9815399.1 hypothetical protein [Candidatus Levybacteria bacterium]
MKTKTQRRKAVEHIIYEFMMFRRTSEFLTSPIQEQLLKNMIIESFAIHSRTLFDFFYKNRSQSDDIIALDYIHPGNKFRPSKTGLSNLSQKTNKQVSHLTYARNNYNFRTKGWNVIRIKSRMELTIKSFMKALEGEEKDWFDKKIREYNIDPITFP